MKMFQQKEKPHWGTEFFKMRNVKDKQMFSPNVEDKNKEMREEGEQDRIGSCRIKAKSQLQSYFGGRNQNDLDKSKIKDIHEENFIRIGLPGGWWGG